VPDRGRHVDRCTAQARGIWSSGKMISRGDVDRLNARPDHPPSPPLPLPIRYHRRQHVSPSSATRPPLRCRLGSWQTRPASKTISRGADGKMRPAKEPMACRLLNRERQFLVATQCGFGKTAGRDSIGVGGRGRLFKEGTHQGARYYSRCRYSLHQACGSL
jgi:hypothetical protein